MASSTWFVDRNWERLREHAVAYVEIDQPGRDRHQPLGHLLQY